METDKKYLIYYNEQKNIIGIREHHFGWKEGDDVITNGVKTTIFAIFDGTANNEEIAYSMMRTLKRYSRVRTTKRIVLTRDDEGTVGIGLLTRTSCKVWKSFDAKLDYVDAMVARMD